ncbi:twin-arginine translocase subunit TatC [Haloarculaceae archaeon H-GB1-1]|nr:twin-arginine translocase subunit TatC [Haloarculaceae archaeon H-GB1-1]
MAGAMDEDTRRAVASGRETLGEMLSTAQQHLQKAFLVFVFGLLVTIYALRMFIWDRLKADLNQNPHIDVIAVTPFDVILLQAKIGMVVGAVLTLPILIYYSRDSLRKRGWWPSDKVPRWKLALLVVFVLTLFTLGVTYSYVVFFPVMLDFLASNAIGAGFNPTWSIVKWTQFIALLSASFGFAAQLPLAMSVLSYTEIVQYETFRDKWRYAVVGIFAFGAVFSPPDPFTQVMWAVPLIGLYLASLKLSKLVVLTKRSSESVDFPAVARKRWNVLAGVALLAGAAVYGFFTRGGVAAVNRSLGRLPPKYARQLPPLDAATGLQLEVAAGIVAGVVALVAVGVTLFYFATQELEQAVDDDYLGGPAPSSVGAPSKIDLDEIPADGVRAAPPEVFEQLDEDEAVDHAQRAMDEDDKEKARAILDRFDQIQSETEDEDADSEPDEDSDVVTQTTTGVVDAFTEEETTEEDIGGYYTDIAFIIDSLTSKSFRIAGVFMVVMVSVFGFLYSGGIKDVKESFLSRMPPQMVLDVDIVTLHPVEALIFEVKFATLLGAVAVLPVVLYYAWPALKERGFARGDRRVLAVWGVTLVGGVVGGSLIGFFHVAPAIISWLATDALSSHMVISYRINNFGWLVIATTVGIGLLAEVPVSMFLFHRGGLVPYEVMRDRWRSVVFAVFVFSMLFTPGDIFTTLLFAIPISLIYGLGLGILWLYTLGGRRTSAKSREPAD